MHFGLNKCLCRLPVRLSVCGIPIFPLLPTLYPYDICWGKWQKKSIAERMDILCVFSLLKPVGLTAQSRFSIIPKCQSGNQFASKPINTI